MKYIRTEDGIYVFEDFAKTRGERCLNHYGYQDKNGGCILGTLEDWKCCKKADTIEELCDGFVVRYPNGYLVYKYKKMIDDYFSEHHKCLIEKVWGAIWTSKGLIYVAKMNEKGELELL